MEAFYVVGIGASAGGIKALNAFFTSLPQDINVAFIVIMHIPRDLTSNLDKLMERVSHMPVNKVASRIEIKPNNIYVISENTYLKIDNGILDPTIREKGNLNRAVNVLFHSLANQLNSKAVGIILSGAGSDGLKGVYEIENNGGIVLVQDPNTAQFTGMPNSIIKFNQPDVIETPEKLAEFLIEYVKRSD